MKHDKDQAFRFSGNVIARSMLIAALLSATVAGWSEDRDSREYPATSKTLVGSWNGTFTDHSFFGAGNTLSVIL